MSISIYGNRWHTLFSVILLALGLTACANLSAERTNAEAIPVSVIGQHHMGPNFNVAVFYVDDAGGSNIGRGGGGGSSVCCAMLPRKWYPGMTAIVRWSIGDWSHENRAEIEAENYQSLRSGGLYKATVPIEQYDNPSNIYVHFFPGGKVRVTTRLKDAIQDGPHDDLTATSGVRVDALFSSEEKVERARQRAEDAKKYGDWR